jgi:hypothetical protein
MDHMTWHIDILDNFCIEVFTKNFLVVLTRVNGLPLPESHTLMSTFC